MQRERIRPYFLILILLAAIVLTFFIFTPFLKPLALAAVFAVILQGLYKRIVKLFGGWPSIAALLTVLLSVLLILLPLTLVGVFVGKEAHGLYLSLEGEGGQSTLAELLTRFDTSVGASIPGLSGFLHGFSANVDSYVKEGLQWIAEHAGAIFSSVSSLLLSFFIFFIALYYLLRDGPRVRQMLVELSPLDDHDDEGVFDRLELAVNSVIRGSLVIALLQGVLTAIGFTLLGVPNGILWGTVAALAALIPGIGTSLIFIPAIVFLYFSSSPLAALGLLAWGIIAVGLIDNALAPRLVGKGMKLHPLLVLLSVLGGILFFGPIGIFLGPLSVSLLFALLSVYMKTANPL